MLPRYALPNAHHAGEAARFGDGFGAVASTALPLEFCSGMWYNSCTLFGVVYLNLKNVRRCDYE